MYFLDLSSTQILLSQDGFLLRFLKQNRNYENYTTISRINRDIKTQVYMMHVKQMQSFVPFKEQIFYGKYYPSIKHFQVDRLLLDILGINRGIKSYIIFHFLLSVRYHLRCTGFEPLPEFVLLQTTPNKYNTTIW